MGDLTEPEVVAITGVCAGRRAVCALLRGRGIWHGQAAALAVRPGATVARGG